MWRYTKTDGWQYCTGTGADDWTSVTQAVAVDAGDNELGRVPARKHAVLEARYRDKIAQGRVNVVGI